MDTHHDPAVINPAAALNDAHNAARQATMRSETVAAIERISAALPYLLDMHRGLDALRESEPSDLSTAELKRLNRLARIAEHAVMEARNHTAEAHRISQREFPEADV